MRERLRQAAGLGLLHGVKEAVRTPDTQPKRPTTPPSRLPSAVTLSGPPTIEVKKADVWPIVSKVFPDYRGRKFKVEVTDKVTLYDTNWGGGTRNSYAAVNIESGKVEAYRAPAPWLNQAEGATVDIPARVVVVERSIFQGKDLGVRVYVRPDDVNPLLTGGPRG